MSSGYYVRIRDKNILSQYDQNSGIKNYNPIVVAQNDYFPLKGNQSNRILRYGLKKFYALNILGRPHSKFLDKINRTLADNSFVSPNHQAWVVRNKIDYDK